MPTLKDTYPLYLCNKAEQPNTDLEVTDKFTGELAFKTALATPEIIDGLQRMRAPFNVNGIGQPVDSTVS